MKKVVEVLCSRENEEEEEDGGGIKTSEVGAILVPLLVHLQHILKFGVVINV
jgi:hypothetical protein